MVRAPLLTVAITASLLGPASAQVTPTDDAQFRRQQEIGRLDAAREGARIERERSGYSNLASGITTRSEPALGLDRLRSQDRLRDEWSRIERESDRFRAEQERQERNRIFGNPSP